MRNKQLTALFLANMLPYAIGIGLMTVMPIYLRQLGSDPAQSGFYLAAIFLALIGGTLAGGQLSRHFNRNKPFLLLGAAGCLPATYLMGQAGDARIWLLFAMAAWFCAGLEVSMVNILTGLSTDQKSRGRHFGVIGMSVGVAEVLGGLSAGPVVDHLGFTALFNICAALYVIQFLFGMMVEEKRAENTQPTSRTATKAASGGAVSMGFWLLLLGSVLVSLGNNTTNLTRTLLMDTLTFDTTAITSVVAVAGAISLPLSFLFGWLSDRVGRKPVLIVCYALTALGIVMLSLSTMLWHFWLAQALVTVSRTGQVIGAVLISDLVSRRQLSTRLSQFAVMPWIGGLVGYAGTGVSIQHLGMGNTFILAALLPVVAIMMLTNMNTRRPARLAADTGSGEWSLS